MRATWPRPRSRKGARIAKLYREHVLSEKPIEGLVRLDSIRPSSNNAASPINRQSQKETDLVAGD